MNIDNRITPVRIKKALNVKTVLIVLLTVFVLSTVLYVTVESLNSREILIWFVTTESEGIFSDEVLKEVNDYGHQRGIDKILMTKRHPEDQYFDALISTGYYNCDIFIMKEEIVQKYSSMEMFLKLSPKDFDGEELIYIGNDAVGILLENDYYLLINAHTKADRQIIYDICDILMGN